MNMKVAIYCRLSEEDRNKQFETDDSNSIQNQKAMLLQYAMEQGWELYNIYSDDDYTGSDNWLRSIYTGFSLYGVFASSVLLITLIPQTKETKSPGR